MRKLFVLLFLCLYGQIRSQSTDGLVAYFPFDGCQAINSVAGSIAATLGGNPACVCGAEGDAFGFNGIDDFMDLSGDLQTIFTGNYTISFYFRPEAASPAQDLLSFRTDCDIDSIIAITYSGVSREVEVELYQNVNRNEILNAETESTSCWQLFTFTKRDEVLTIYINGNLVTEESNPQPILITNEGALSFFNSPCVGITQERFTGTIDEFRLYNRALSLREVKELYVRPDNIVNVDTTILKGDSFASQVSESCADQFSWSPSQGLSDASIANPIVGPDVTTQYILRMQNDICTVFDTLQVNVIDPEGIDCENVFLPKAFTPNGDGLNDVYLIDNPFVFDRLIAFRIFSAWGEKIFETTNAFQGWDGMYRGKEINAGSFVYRVEYVCAGQEKTATGSFSVLR